MTRLVLFLGLLLLINPAYSFQDINAFVYHRFGDDRFPSTNIDLDKFEAHLKHLKSNGYEVLTISESLVKIDKQKSSNDKIAAITIDDGFKSFYENGLPLLEQYGFKATLYVNTETVGARDYMSWDELRDAQKRGVEIGNHSHGHPYFLNLSIEAFKEDLNRSETLFRQNLGKIPKTYAYPYGEWNQQMATILEDSGYTSAMAQNSGVIGTGSNRYYLPRFPMSNAYAALDKFIEKLNVRSLNNSDIDVIKSGYMGTESKPRIVLRFPAANLDLASFQAFIQGTSARKTLEVVKDEVIKFSVWPAADIKRRRTLFTVTTKDKSGNWYWFSYLYVLPKIAEN